VEQEENERVQAMAAQSRLRGVAGGERYALLPAAAKFERDLMQLPVYWQTKNALQNTDGTFRYTIDSTGARVGDGTGHFGVDSFGRWVDLDA
jgi:hypothetical protein